MFAPAGTPPASVSRLSRDLVNALESSDLSGRLKALGVEPWPGDAAALGRLLRTDIERYGDAVRFAGLPKQ